MFLKKAIIGCFVSALLFCAPALAANGLTVNGAVNPSDILEITQEGVYTISSDGQTTDRILVNAPDETVTLRLSGVNINTVGARANAVEIRAAEKCIIILENGTANSLTSSGSWSALNNHQNPLIIACESAAKSGAGHECTAACGSLDAKNTTDNSLIGAAIGSDFYEECKNITINGGIIYAKSYHGAGIGSGDSKDAENITINGGRISATSSFGAGIGGGGGGAGKNIVINGGYIEATSKGPKVSSGSGIGSGWSGKQSSVCIHGGVIRAYGNGGAAIGGTNSSVTIYDGDIEANSYCGAGIGSAGNIKVNGGSVAIYGGRIRAGSQTGSGIGQGTVVQGVSVTLAGGDIEAVSLLDEAISGGSIIIDPPSGGIFEAIVGADAESAVNLEGSPFSSKTDVTSLLSKPGAYYFRSIGIPPEPVSPETPTLPETGDGASIALWISMIALGGIALLKRKYAR